MSGRITWIRKSISNEVNPNQLNSIKRYLQSRYPKKFPILTAIVCETDKKWKWFRFWNYLFSKTIRGSFDEVYYHLSGAATTQTIMTFAICLLLFSVRFESSCQMTSSIAMIWLHVGYLAQVRLGQKHSLTSARCELSKWLRTNMENSKKFFSFLTISSNVWIRH